jgi:hypothetical protein
MHLQVCQTGLCQAQIEISRSKIEISKLANFVDAGTKAAEMILMQICIMFGFNKFQQLGLQIAHFANF